MLHMSHTLYIPHLAGSNLLRSWFFDYGCNCFWRVRVQRATDNTLEFWRDCFKCASICSTWRATWQATWHAPLAHKYEMPKNVYNPCLSRIPRAIPMLQKPFMIHVEHRTCINRKVSTSAFSLIWAVSTSTVFVQVYWRVSNTTCLLMLWAMYGSVVSSRILTLQPRFCLCITFKKRVLVKKCGQTSVAKGKFLNVPDLIYMIDHDRTR